MTVDTSRIGTAVEHLLASSMILASNLVLNASTSLVDDEGVDLVFHKRDSPATLAVQVKSRTTEGSHAKDSTFLVDVRAATFAARPDLYILGVLVDLPTATYGPAWLVPSEEFATTANRISGGDKLRLRTSLNPASKDKWSGYRLERGELPGQIVSILDRLERLEATGD